MMTSAIVDERISEKCERSLMKLGFNIIKTKASSRLGEAVRSHPDILMFAHGQKIITSADYCDEALTVFSDIREYAPNFKVEFTSDILTEKYPYDALFNALVLKDRIYLKADSASEAVKRYAEEAGLKTVNVKQGYPACTVLAFGGSAITADLGMARALGENGIRVTVIENGGISLPPHEYGFIGGAAGVFDGKVYFLGDYATHPSGDLIEKALKEEKYTPVSLSDEGLADLGRIIFLQG